MSVPSRNTRQRSEILDALDRADGFRSAQELHHELVARDARVGLTTVYRTLQALVTTGEVDSLLNEAGEAIYRLCGHEGHHHHLVCRDCGRAVEIASDEIESWASKTARKHGFTRVTHTAELYGLCRPCSRS